MNNDIATLVTAARRRAGYRPIYAMAKATGLPKSLLRDIEKGVSSPSIETLTRIMDAIEWDVIVGFQPRRK